MKRLGLFLVAICLQSAGLFAQSEWSYPETRKADVVDDYHGIKVADPFRWLEDDRSAETAEWVKEQNAVTFNYLNSIPFRGKLNTRLEQLWNYAKISAPSKKGDNWFTYYNDGLQNQSVLYMSKTPTEKGEVLIDPNTLSKDGTSSLTNFDVSNDGKYAVYGVSVAGSDWRKLYVMNLQTKQKISDEIEWVKFSNAAWYQEGFYYSRYEAPQPGSELTAQNTLQKVYFHKIGSPQSDDVLIYEDPANPKLYYDVDVTEDERYAILSISQGAASHNKIYYKDLTKPDRKDFLPIINEFNGSYGVIDNLPDGKLIVITNFQAPQKRIVLIDPKNPAVSNWKDLIPQSKETLVSASLAGGKMIVQTLKDVISKLYVYDLAGKRLSEIVLPGPGTVAGLSAKKDLDDIYFVYTSYTTPPTVYHYNLKTAKTEIFRQPKLNFKPEDYVTKQVFYPSKDGTKIPLFITHKKDLKLDGTAPTMLYAYGGFNISLQPAFSPANIILLENGGIYAVANLRGGSEYGEDWHKAGMLEKKQNVFDDFIAAAEYLIKEKYTNPKRLAIMGGSNGGLLVGAVMLQRPELFAVAFPRVGVLDMLRFHKFTVGWGWVGEYGSSDDPEQFKYLYKYSPLHNVKKGVAYPATMVMTSDHDDRVVPAHSFKFAAELQDKCKGPNPMFIRIETSAGHGAGLPTKKQIEAAADVWAFMFQVMNVSPK
jgi:prolyl oligopeptidase